MNLIDKLKWKEIAEVSFLALGLGITSRFMLQPFIGKFSIPNNNANVKFSKIPKEENQKWEYSEDLIVSMNEPFQLFFTCWDKDTIKTIDLYKNEKIFLTIPGDEFRAYVRYFTCIESLPGGYNYKLVVTDNKNNKNEKIGKVIVENKPYQSSFPKELLLEGTI